MPHYYFDVHDGIHVVDELGQDLPGLEAAKTEAIRIAGGFATRPAMLGSDGGALSIVVRAAPGVTTMTIRLVYNIDMADERLLDRV